MWHWGLEGRDFLPQVRTPIQEDSPRNGRVRALLPDCRCHSGCCGGHQYGALSSMNAGFRYLLDPLFIVALGTYALHKWSPLWPDALRSLFTERYLGDLLLVPVALPGLLFLARVAGLRQAPSPPRFIEILIPLSIWSVAFEFLGPTYFGRGTPDPVDVIFYGAGGLAAWLIWNRGPAMHRALASSSFVPRVRRASKEVPVAAPRTCVDQWEHK